MPTAKYMLLVAKSRAACLAAVECYNRTSILYREETFAILMINAWELLLKARIIREHGGKVSAIHEFRFLRKKDGTQSKRKKLKLSRSGSPMTIGIERCWNLVAGYSENSIDENCIANIQALMEIRDNAIHFVATDALLRKKLTEISLAAVRNYVEAAQAWFSVTFSDLNIASIPISFDLDQKEVDAIAKKSAPAVTKFLTHMKKVEEELPRDLSPYSFTVRVDFDLIKNKEESAIKSAIVSPSEAELTVRLERDTVPPGFTLTYQNLTKKMKERYTNFKQNRDFHVLMNHIKSDEKLCYERYLDPLRRKGTKKVYFNPNVLKVFDLHYSKKGATLFELDDERNY